MKILLIAHSFPPAPIVGAFRAGKVAEAFRSAGHQVEVVTARLPDEPGATRVEERNFGVHVVDELPGPLDLYGWLKRQLTQPSSSASQPAGDAGALSPQRSEDPGPRWKRYILSSLVVPDKNKGFIVPAVMRSLPIVRGGVDLVYTTVPPYSDHLIGLVLKKMTGVRWVAEFRDPWTDNRKAADLRSAGADRVNRWLEKLCLDNADQIVSVAEGIHQLLTAKVPEPERDRFLVALNGIDNLSARRPPTDGSGPFRIVHTGSFYGGRDPRPFLVALGAVARKRRLSAENVRVELIGNSRNYRGVSLEDLAAELGIAELIEFYDWMPQEQARERSGTADLLLLPFLDPDVIPNKLYDYLGARRAILAFVDAHGEAARMLNRVGGHYLVTDSDPGAAERTLEAALDGRNAPPPSRGQDAILEEWTTEVQMRRLMAGLAVVPEQKSRADFAKMGAAPVEEAHG